MLGRKIVPLSLTQWGLVNFESVDFVSYIYRVYGVINLVSVSK